MLAFPLLAVPFCPGVSIDNRGQHRGQQSFCESELPQMSLTNTAVLNAKPGTKAVKLFDDRGLYLEVAPAGGKWWRHKYRFEGKEKRLSLGVYPDVGPKEARERRDDARKLLASGVDPGARRRSWLGTNRQPTASRLSRGNGLPSLRSLGLQATAIKRSDALSAMSSHGLGADRFSRSTLQRF